MDLSYRGYDILKYVKQIKRYSCTTRLSWTEVEETSLLYVSGPFVSVSKHFKSVDNAKKYIDFVIKFEAPFFLEMHGNDCDCSSCKSFKELNKEV